MAQPAQSSSFIRHATWRDTFLWLCRRYYRLRITGDSMRPLLAPGQEILVAPKAYRDQLPQPGEIVVAVHPHQPDLHIIKRVRYVQEGNFYLSGDNRSASQDSRHFGLIPQSSIRGKVVCRFP